MKPSEKSLQQFEQALVEAAQESKFELTEDAKMIMLFCFKSGFKIGYKKGHKKGVVDADRT